MTRTAIAALVAVVTLGPWSQLQAANLSQKIGRIEAQTARAQAGWKATRSALRSLARNKPLRAALGAKGDAIVLGERSGSYNHASVAYGKSLHFGLTSFTGWMAVKVKWKEQLVLGPKGLRVRTLRSYSKPTEASVKAFQADLEAQFARKPSVIRMPDTKVEYKPYTEMQIEQSKKARLGFFGFGSRRLKAAEWGHVTAPQIENALQGWSNTP